MLQNQSEIESCTVMEIAIKFLIFFTEKVLLNKNTWHVRQISLLLLLFEYGYSKLKTHLPSCIEHKCLSTSLEYKTYLVTEKMMSTESQIPLCITN